MLSMNVLRLYTHWLPVLFGGWLLIAITWIFDGRLVPSTVSSDVTDKDRLWLAWLALSVGILFACARIPYLLEGTLHHLVGPVVYDDTWHFQEINSLVNSIRYPAQCSLIPSRYFSFYYAPWMAIAALYLAFPIHGFTIKMSFAIGCAIYQILMCLALLHIGLFHARNRRQLYWAIYIIAFWAGMESLFALLYYSTRNPGWMLVSDSPIHLPIFANGMFWAIHHMTAALALLLCWHVWSKSQSVAWKKNIFCGLLIAYAFFSSIFVFLAAIPFGLLVICLDYRFRWKSILATACLSAALIWPLLWLYLGKSNDVRFLFPFMTSLQSLLPYAAHHESAFPLFHGLTASLWIGFIAYLIFLGVNFLPQAVALGFYGKRLSWNDRGFCLIAVAFLISTYFIGFPEGDNYASRGLLIPILVLSWICAGLLPPIRISSWVAIALFLGGFGFVHECVHIYKYADSVAKTPQGGAYSKEILSINQDRSSTTAPLTDWLNQPGMIYDVEKFVAGGKRDPVTADRQLECLGPRGLWRWQQIPENVLKYAAGHSRYTGPVK